MLKGLGKLIRGSVVEINSQVFILNILQFDVFEHFATNLSVFSLINYVCLIANLFCFHEMYTFYYNSYS